MIARYTRKKMAQIWSAENRFQKMLDVEIAVAKVEAKHKLIPQKAARDIAARGKFKVSRIEEIEKTTRHDTIAFVQSVAENVGPESGAYVHFGLTSSDVLDTALGLQLKDATDELYLRFLELEKTLVKVAGRHATTLCAGRTHGMHAELTSFGVKMAGYLAELKRHDKRFITAMKQAIVGKLSGAVGTYSSLPATVETDVCKILGLMPELSATQVIPRDRLAEVFCVLGLLGGFIERLALEFRHLQRTEVSEVIEAFHPGQKGSSAMPHKKNPISAENLTGLARLLRSYVTPALENMALWHERDISHSSVERVLLPDAFIVADFAMHRLNELVAKAYIDKARMSANIELSSGALFSSQILLLLVRKGLTRDEAYKIVQEVSHGLKKGERLEDKIVRHPEVKSRVTKGELKNVFKESHYRDRFKGLVTKVIRA